MNGDGRDDVTFVYDSSGLKVRNYHSIGATISATPVIADLPDGAVATRPLVGDIDGDGRDDIVLPFYSGSPIAPIDRYRSLHSN